MIGWHLHFSPCSVAELEVEVLGSSKMKKNKTKKTLQSAGCFATGTLRNETKGQREEMRWSSIVDGFHSKFQRFKSEVGNIVLVNNGEGTMRSLVGEGLQGKMRGWTGRRPNTQQQYSGRCCYMISAQLKDHRDLFRSCQQSWFCSEKLLPPIREMFVSMTTWQNIKK